MVGVSLVLPIAGYVLDVVSRAVPRSTQLDLKNGNFGIQKTCVEMRRITGMQQHRWKRMISLQREEFDGLNRGGYLTGLPHRDARHGADALSS